MTKKTLEQLQEQHSEMCATAHDLGMTVPLELTTDFTSVEVGSTVVSNLDALIRKFREGLDEAEKVKNVLAEDDVKSDTVSPSSKKRTKKTTTKKDGAVPSTEQGVTTVAKAATKKAAPKKGATKKAAKKSAAKTNGTNGTKRPAFDDGAKIAWGAGKENPAREGTGRHDRIEAVRKANGKTVKTFIAAKGNPTTLKNCVAAKLCTVA